MAQKKLNFDNPLFSESEPTTKRGRPSIPTTIHGDTRREGMQPGNTRFSVMMSEELADFLRDYAYTKRQSMKDTINEIVGAFRANYEADPNNEPLLESRDKSYKGAR